MNKAIPAVQLSMLVMSKLPVYAASAFLGGGNQANPHKESTDGSIGLNQGFPHNSRKHPLLVAAKFLLSLPGKTDPEEWEIPRCYKTLTSLARVSKMALQWAMVRTFPSCAGTFCLECSTILL
jgi:hypothetical protein